MGSLLRVLHLEDDPDYSDLVGTMLQKEGYEVELVLAVNRVQFEAALMRDGYDIILADYLLPEYNGLDALRTAKKLCPETPFLLVSGTIGEQAAIESLKTGATDYVLKLWPERLIPAVRRAVRETCERRERKQAQTELFRREKYFRALTENCLDILTILNREGIYIYNSPSLKRVLGYEPKELAGRSAFSLVHPDDLAGVQDIFQEALSYPDRTLRREFRFRHQDGSWRFLEVVGQNRLSDPEIGGIVINSRDISDRKTLEEQLRQAQKMEAIGQLAGGVAHDFNNILTVIQGHAALLEMGGRLSGPAARSAQQIKQAAERASALTRQLLAFSRRQVMQPRPLDLNETVRNMSKMLARILGEDIQLDLEYATRPAVVHADSGMLEQVLMNLAVNSRDAMPQGGVLAIKIAPGASNGSAAKNGTGDPLKWVRLTVSDTGCGIAPEFQRRIFEPFFTTKEMGKGTGLGLATVYGIVKQHQGRIEVESQVGAGTTFTVFLPASAQAPEANHKPVAEKPVRGGNETILIVEDEGPVRELVCNLLAGYGYKIVQANSGVKALEAWAHCQQKVDLLLTDLVMPDRMNGRELAEKLWTERPGLKVIFTSGYSAEVVGKDFVLRRGLNYLQKPYEPHQLAHAIRDCLDGVN